MEDRHRSLDPRVGKRFWERVDRSAGPDACWTWTRSTTVDGYGWVKSVRHPYRRAHRLAYALATGAPVPIGACVLHRCDNPSCCNPAHLFLGTTQENTADKVAKGRQMLGERNRNARLRASDVLEIRRRAALGEPRARIAASYGVHVSQVYKVATRRAWSHL